MAILFWDPMDCTPPMLQQQDWVVATESIQPPKPKIFSIWLFTEKVSNPWYNQYFQNIMKAPKEKKIKACGILIYCKFYINYLYDLAAQQWN